MNIIVCVKQVPASNETRLDPVTHTIMRDGAAILNPFDAYAVEEALRLRDENGGTVTAISMGPLQAKEALEECLGMGADEAVLLSDRLVGGSDTLATGYALSQLAKILQPDIIINDRLGLGRGVGTPEQYQKSSKADKDGKPIVWEACQTLNNSWGYDRDNLNWKSSEMVIKLLIDTVAKGGNMLLNIGPNGRGEIDARTMKIMDDVKAWMRLHSESIYGCGPSSFEAPADARFTQKGNHLYLHLFSWPYRSLLINGLGGEVEYAQLLNDHSEIKFIQDEGLSGKRKSHKDLNKEITEIHIKDKFADKAMLITLPVQKPDVAVPVIEFILKEQED